MDDKWTTADFIAELARRLEMTPSNLSALADVATRIPYALRSPRISFEHHAAIACFDMTEAEQREAIQLAASSGLTPEALALKLHDRFTFHPITGGMRCLPK